MRRLRADSGSERGVEVKCSWGGCQSLAVVTLLPVHATPEGFDYDDDAELRPACRYHMGILCQPDPLVGYSTHIVEAL